MVDGAMRSSRLIFLFHDLNQVAACIVEGGDNNTPGIGGRLYEPHAFRHETLVFSRDVVDRDGRQARAQAPSHPDHPRIPG